MEKLSESEIEEFIQGQVKAWNARDKPKFIGYYKSVTPGSLKIEYANRPIEGNGWAVLEQMWESSNNIVDIDVIKTIINGNEAICYHINRMPSRNLDIHTMEIYHFDGQDLSVKYFIKPEAGV